jgi:4'-phosphopantetheinyl transferase EntD
LRQGAGARHNAKRLYLAEVKNFGNMPGHPESNLADEATQVASLLTRWLPDGTFVRATRIEDYPILPEEDALIADAVERRRHEFTTGRWLARSGLRHFGLPDSPILIGRLRNPLWPDGVLGTLSHDGELCAVALRRTDGEVRGIGIDLIAHEQRAGRMEELAPIFVTKAAELGVIATLNPAADPPLLLFSLKEAVIKALTFRLDDFIDMRDIEICDGRPFAIRIADGTIDAGLFAAMTNGYLVTAATIR